MPAGFAESEVSGFALRTGDVLIRVFIGGALQPELLDLPDDGLRRIALDELTELFGRFTGMPVVTDIARWPALNRRSITSAICRRLTASNSSPQLHQRLLSQGTPIAASAFRSA